MKKIIRTFYVLLLSALFSGCDPARVLKMSVRKNSYSKLFVYCNKQFISRSFSDTNKTVLALPFTIGGTTKHDTSFFFGIGTWADDTLLKIHSKHVDSIVFQKSRGSKTLNGAKEIFEYLKTHRKGGMKQILEISTD